MKRYLFILIVLSFFDVKPQIISESASLQERNKLKSELTSFIYETIKSEVNSSTEADWVKALWGIEFLMLKNDSVFNALKFALNEMGKMNNEFKYRVMETSYGLYKKEFRAEFEKYITTFNPKLFAIIANYFIQSCADQKIEKENLFAYMEDNFKYYWNNPILFSLSKDFQNINYPLPQLATLLKHNFNNKLVVFSFQRKNREYPGLTIVRGADGNFIKDEYGNLFSVPQLAYSVSNLPTYLTNGNTPEGIYSIQNIKTSDNIFIGPNPVVELALPYETTPDKFFHNNDTSKWDLSLYQRILPESWRKYYPIFKSYYAGHAGRNEILIHGSSIDPELYKTLKYYPFTPSLGCITSKELWDEDGKLIDSGQLKLINLLKSQEDYKGYFILIELNDKESPVEIEEITNLLPESNIK